jgi:hypothetical protein
MDTKAINKFIDKMLVDKALRKEFADNPKGVLKKEGIELPAGAIADKIDANLLEERLNALSLTMGTFDKMGVRLDKFSALAGLQRSGKIPDSTRMELSAIMTII